MPVSLRGHGAAASTAATGLAGRGMRAVAAPLLSRYDCQAMGVKVYDYATRDPATNLEPSWPMRLWLAASDWLFRVLGAAIFVAFIAARVPIYWRDFWLSGSYFRPQPGVTWYVPWGNVLVDVT